MSMGMCMHAIVCLCVYAYFIMNVCVCVCVCVCECMCVCLCPFDCGLIISCTLGRTWRSELIHEPDLVNGFPMSRGMEPREREGVCVCVWLARVWCVFVSAYVVCVCVV